VGRDFTASVKVTLRPPGISSYRWQEEGSLVRAAGSARRRASCYLEPRTAAGGDDARRWGGNDVCAPLETAVIPTTELERPTTPWRTRRVVFFSFALDIVQTGALATAAALTGSSALVAQTFAVAASIAVQLFLVVGVLTSTRAPDASHPLG
jgi:hypothetical protein